MAVSLQDDSRGSLLDALAALGDACMTVRRVVEAEETRSVYTPWVRRAVDRRDELYARFLELYAAEPQREVAAGAGEEAPRIALEARRPARERSRSPRMGPVGFPSVPYLLESTADLRRRIVVLQRDAGLGCASCELEALQRLLWYREGEVGGAGSGSSSSRYRSRQEL